MFLASDQHISLETTRKKHLILRLVCFLVTYPLFYAVPIALLWVLPLSILERLPGQMANFLFVLPTWTFPFGQIMSDKGQQYFFSEPIGWLIMAVYLTILGFLFLKLTQPINKLRWLIPLAFCFCALSILLLNCFFVALGIQVFIDAP
jgi:hypothetical protein